MRTIKCQASRLSLIHHASFVCVSVFLFLATSQPVQGQGGNLLWAKRAGGTARYARGFGITVDGAGNSYVTGFFEGSATFGSGEPNQTTLTAARAVDSNIFVAKYNSNGTLAWAKRADGSGDIGLGIAVDGSGNIYVTGDVEGPTTFGQGEANQTTIDSFSDIFVAKYNSSGVFQWAKGLYGTSLIASNGVAADSAGNSYVTGFFDGTVTFGRGETNQTVISSGNDNVRNIFVAKYDSSGVLQWAKRAGGASNDEGDGIAVDASGNSYVTGYFSGTATFGQGETNQTILTTASIIFFVAKYNSSGLLQWVKRAVVTGSAYGAGYGIGVDGAANSYVTGEFGGTVTFGQGEANQTTLTSGALGITDVFIAKYSSSGTLLWARRAGGQGLNQGLGLAVDGSGNSYVTGTFAGMATFGQNEANQTTLTESMNSNGYYYGDVFVAKYDSSGALQWAKRAGGIDIDVGTGIAVDGSGHSYVTGYFGDTFLSQTATFGPGEPNQTVLTNSAGSNIFVAKFANQSPVADWRMAGTGDFNGDGQRDILIENTTTGQKGIWFMNGSTLTSGSVFTTVPTDWRIAGTGDFNGDGQTDILVENTSTGQKGIWFMNGSTLTSGSVFVTVSTAWRIVGTGDFNGDGKTDILIENTSTGQKGIWFMNGSTLSSGSVFTTVSTDWRIAATGDFNGDGKTDILVENTSTGQKGIWFMNGSSLSSGSVFTTVPTDWRMAATGDFNGDGKTDILVENASTGQKGIWFMNGSTITSGSVFVTVPTH